MSAQNVRTFYTDILASLNIHDVGEGLLTLKFPVGDGEFSEKPCTSNSKRLTLPTDALIRSGKWEGLLAFHPLSENLLRGESEVLKFIRTMVRFRLSSTASQLMSELMGIAADPERHKELKPKQAEFLKQVQNANDKTESLVNTKLLSRHFDDLLNIYLKRGGQFKGEEYRRVAAVSFPIWDELNAKGKMIYDIDCGSVKNKKTIASMFEFIFPNPDDQNQWSAASNETVAPYFQALMQCYARVAHHLNALVHKYRKHLQFPDMLKIPLDWVVALEHLPDWKGLIAPLPGNEGATMKGEREVEAVKAPAAEIKPRGHSSFVPPVGNVANQRVAPDNDTPPWETQPEKVVPPVASPYTPPAHAAAKEAPTGKINWRDHMAATQRATPPPPPPVAAAYGHGYPTPPPAPVYPGYAQQPQQQWGGYQQPQQRGYPNQGGPVYGGSL